MPQYIPGFAEQILPYLQQAISGVRDQIAPDFYAKRRYQDMIQQDPSLVSKLADMPLDQREAFAQSLGAKDKIDQLPFMQLNAGPKLQAERRQQAAFLQATPDQMASVNANAIGAPTQEAINQNRTLFGQNQTTFNNQQQLFPTTLQEAQTRLAQGKQNLEVGDQQIQVNKFKLKDLQDQQANDDAALSKYPDLSKFNMGKVVDDAVNGQVDPMVMQVLSLPQNKGAMEAFQQAMQTKRTDIAYQHAYNLQNIKTDAQKGKYTMNELAQNASAMDKGVDNAQAQLRQIDSEEQNFAKTHPDFATWNSMPPSMQVGKGAKFKPDQSTMDAYADLQKRKSAAQSGLDLMIEGHRNVLGLIPDIAKAMQKTQGATPNPQGQPNTQVQQTQSGPSQNALATEQFVLNKKLSLEQALASPILTDADRQYLRQKLGGR